MQTATVDRKIAAFLQRKDIKFPELGLSVHGDSSQTIKFESVMAV